MKTITIDCGASFLKGALIQNGKIETRMRLKAPRVHGGEDITNPVQIQALIPMVTQMVMELAGRETEVRLCISNEMHGFLLAYENGRPYTDYISWQKEYSAVEIEGRTAVGELKQRDTAGDIFYTGMPLRAGLPSSNLLYLRKRGYLENVQTKLRFYTLGDYILRAVSGKEPMCHPTNAAGTGLYDLRDNTWNRRLINAAGGEGIIFPQIGREEIIFFIGSLKVNALPAIGDQQAALLGAGLKDETAISFNLGTGAQVSKVVSEAVFSDRYQIRPYFGGTYLKTIPYLPSGRALNVYIRFFQDILCRFRADVTEDEIWAVLLKAEQEGKETGLSCDLSFYENAATNSRQGSITHIEEYSLTLGNVMRTVFRQMSENFIRAADIVENNTSRVDRVIFSGGVARKIPKIREYISEHYRAGISTQTVSDETFFGLYIYGQGEENI